MYQENAQVLWNKAVGPGHFRIGLTCDEKYANAQPGQFVMLGLPERLDPLLRRPFSIHRRVQENGRTKGIELLYKVVGVTTKRMATLSEGDVLHLFGPLGRGFFFPDVCRRVFIVAGGIGVAPMPFLAEYLIDSGADPSESRVFIGGGSQDDLLCRDEFNRLGMHVHVTTDDGSEGDQCLVTLPFESVINRESRPDIIYACGPMAMLKCVINIARAHEIPCQVSIETMMACGMGACLGCAVEGAAASNRYLHACVDGPVFDANELKLEI
jgi:dihydroorotate dehydrogenase electron transfer subunit